MTKKNIKLDPKAPDVETTKAEKEAKKAEAATHFKIKLKKVPEIAEEKEFGDKITVDDGSGEEKAPVANRPASSDERVGEAHELDPGIAGNAGQKDPSKKEEDDHKNY